MWTFARGLDISSRSQRREGDWQVNRKNPVGFLTNASADAVGFANEPHAPHLQTMGSGRHDFLHAVTVV